MASYPGHILCEDIVVNYKSSDRDDCLHFLTNLDTTCHNLASFVSPTAKRIYTSKFNAWFLKINFDVKHIYVQGFDTNKSYKITYKGNKYIYSFIDTKFSTGSVALLLHGDFGSYFYTGNFSYSSSFISPVLLPVIEKKALTRLYLDNTYYEKPSDFLGFDEISSIVVKLIKSKPTSNFFIYSEKITMDPLVADIAAKLKEKIYVCESTMLVMKFLGYESFFTRNSNQSRICVDRAFHKKRNFEHDNIAIHLNRCSKSCTTFKKIERNGNVYIFNFYCHSNHKEICELLRILKPESMTFLFSEIDKSKLSYNFKFKYDLPKNILFKKSSTKTSINVDRVTKKVVKKIPRRLISPAIINDNSTDEITDLGSKTIISVSEDSSGSITNGGGDTYPQGTSENQDNTHPQSISGNHNVTQLYSTEQNCSFRVRKVPEINNAGFSGESNCTKEDTVNKYDENLTFNNEINCNKSNETNSCVKKETHSDVQSHSTSDFFHNPKPNQPLKLIKLDGNNSAENSLIPSNLKTLSSCIVQTKTGMRLVFNPKLVKDNRLNGTNSKIIKISNIGVVSNGQKKTILVKRKYVDVKQPCVITIPPDDTQNTKLNYVENRKHFLTKNSIMSLKSKTSDTNINTNDTCDLNVSNTFYDSRDTLSVPNNSLQKLENNFNLPEESIPCDSEIFDKESINLETPGNNTIDEDRDSNSLEDCINLQPGHNINQSDDRLVEFHPQDNQQTCNEKNISDYSPMKSLDKSIIDNRTEAGNGSYGKSTNSQSLEPLNVNSNGNKFFKNNCQELKKDNPIAISKQGLSSDENEQSRKKLRSEILRPCLLKSSHQRGDPVLLQDLKILIRRNGFDRTYFFSVKNNCYLPKFHGFKKHEVRPRSMLIALKKLQRLSKN